MTKTEHLLSCLAEECNEVAQRVSKALRFSLLDVQTGQGLNNLQRIVVEIRDLQAVMEMLEDHGVLRSVVWTRDVKAIEAKKEKVQKYLQYSLHVGTVSEASYENECPICGGGPLYMDRDDASRNVAHCDDCGEEIPGDVYQRITSV